MIPFILIILSIGVLIKVAVWRLVGSITGVARRIPTGLSRGLFS